MILFFEDRYFTQMQSRWIYRHWGCITRSSYTKVNQQWHVGSWQVYRGVYKRMPRKRVQMSVWSLKKCPANLHQGEPSGGAAGHLPSEGKILEHEDATLFARGRSHSCAFRSTCIRKKKGILQQQINYITDVTLPHVLERWLVRTRPATDKKENKLVSPLNIIWPSYNLP